MINDKEITEEEAWETYSKLLKLPKCYEYFMNEFFQEINAWPIRGTVIEYTKSPWEIKEGDFSF